MTAIVGEKDCVREYTRGSVGESLYVCECVQNTTKTIGKTATYSIQVFYTHDIHDYDSDENVSTH